MHNPNFYRNKDDLRWMLTSPPLFSHQIDFNETSPWSSAAIEQFLAETLNTEILRNWFSSAKNHRLGNYFEQLMHYYLAHAHQVEEVIRTIPLRESGKTLGELDFVYRSIAEQPFSHLEVAVKFYLNIGDPTDSHQWRGLDAKDTLGNKIERLITHQLPIVETPVCKEILQRQNIHIGSSQAIVKGRLFYPWKQFIASEFTYPSYISANHLKGWCLRVADVDMLKKDHTKLYPLRKNYWLAPLDEEAIHQLTPLHLDSTDELDYPQMVARVDADNMEVDRGIILPNQWPEKISLSE